MSFDNKQYPNRKDNRRRYPPGSAKDVDRSCRNHGSDTFMEKHRLIRTIKTEMIAKSELANFDLEEGIGGA